jgi:hypothetical protein
MKTGSKDSLQVRRSVSFVSYLFLRLFSLHLLYDDDGKPRADQSVVSHSSFNLQMLGLSLQGNSRKSVIFGVVETTSSVADRAHSALAYVASILDSLNVINVPPIIVVNPNREASTQERITSI